MAAPHGYAQTAQIDLGNCKMIIISGQVAFDNKGTLVGNGDFEKQAEQVFLNLKNTVESAGGSMDDIVKLGIYVIDMSQIQTLRAVRDKFVNVKHPPASTLVQVNKLFRDDVLIEVEATAIVPNKKWKINGRKIFAGAATNFIDKPIYFLFLYLIKYL